MHATAFLKSPDPQKLGGIVPLWGQERALKLAVIRALTSLVVGSDDDEASVTRFPGKDADFKSVRDELLTVSMWGEGRLVIVEDADTFVSDNRAALEKYLEKPSKKSLLVLDVKSWPKTTRLAKGVSKQGFDVECSELEGAALVRWLQDTARDAHGKQLARDAASLIPELAGNGLGLLEQELAKLAAYVGERGTITADDVGKLVGGWKAETTWTMINAVQEGRLGEALAYLEKLLVAGEAAPRILGGISYSFRKLAQATERARRGRPLSGALRDAGVFPRDADRAAAYLRRIGRPCAERINALLVEADANLKGGSRVSDRVQLEQLLLELSGRV